MARGYKRPESVLVVVYDSTGRVLLLRRRELREFWQSVTGSLEWGESPDSAAERELFEETGIAGGFVENCHETRSFPIYRQFLYRYRPGVTHNREHVFRVRVPHVSRVRLDPVEHDGWVWKPRLKAAAQASSYTNREAILKHVPAIGTGGGK